MALPTLYIDTGGANTNSGSSDNNSAIVSSVSAGTTAAVSGATVTFSGATDLSGVAADGSQTIYINDATNTNQKIFKITAVNDAADTVTVTPNPTGTISASSWAIGGRFLASSGSYGSIVSAAVLAGWTVQFNNSPASHSGSDFIVVRAGGVPSGDGVITLKGKAATTVTLTVSDTNQVIQNDGSARHHIHVRNLTCVQQGASGSPILAANDSFDWVLDDIRITDGGGTGFQSREYILIDCEIGSCDSAIASTTADANSAHIGCYFHDLTNDGFGIGGTSRTNVFCGCIFDTCGGRGVYNVASVSNALSYLIYGCTFYACGNSGIEISDADVQVSIYGCIFQDNGNAAGEFNVESPTTGQGIVHGFNVFYHQGGGGGANLSNVTVNATEATTDPLFTNAPNGDFSIPSNSPAKGTGFPGVFPGDLSTGYPDMGAVQRQESAASGGGLKLAGRGGLAG